MALVVDYLAVFSYDLGVVAYPLAKSLGVAGDYRDGSLQLVRNIADEGFAGVVKGVPALDILLELLVFILEVDKRCVKRRRQGVDAPAELTYLILAVVAAFALKIQRRHVLGYVVHLDERVGEPRDDYEYYHRDGKHERKGHPEIDVDRRGDYALDIGDGVVYVQQLACVKHAAVDEISGVCGGL